MKMLDLIRERINYHLNTVELRLNNCQAIVRLGSYNELADQLECISGMVEIILTLLRAERDLAEFYGQETEVS